MAADAPVTCPGSAGQAGPTYAPHKRPTSFPIIWRRQTRSFCASNNGHEKISRQGSRYRKLPKRWRRARARCSAGARRCRKIAACLLPGLACRSRVISLHDSGLDVDAIAAEVGYVDGATLRTLLRQRLGRGVRELRADGALTLWPTEPARYGTHAQLLLAFWASIGFKPGEFMTIVMNEKRAPWLCRVLNRMTHRA